jgi:hypothetical protein
MSTELEWFNSNITNTLIVWTGLTMVKYQKTSFWCY